MMRKKVKITVIKKLSATELYGNEQPCHWTIEETCPRFEVGQEFIAPEDGSCPAGFCAWAFADLHRDITHLRFGGDYPMCEEKGTAVQCCTDGMRPVFFKLERMD